MSCAYCAGLGPLLLAPFQDMPGSFEPQGEPGVDTGFGQLHVAGTRVDPEDYFAAGVRRQLIVTPDPIQRRRTNCVTRYCVTR